MGTRSDNDGSRISSGGWSRTSTSSVSTRRSDHLSHTGITNRVAGRSRTCFTSGCSRLPGRPAPATFFTEPAVGSNPLASFKASVGVEPTRSRFRAPILCREPGYKCVGQELNLHSSNSGWVTATWARPCPADAGLHTQRRGRESNPQGSSLARFRDGCRRRCRLAPPCLPTKKARRPMTPGLLASPAWTVSVSQGIDVRRGRTLAVKGRNALRGRVRHGNLLRHPAFVAGLYWTMRPRERFANRIRISSVTSRSHRAFGEADLGSTHA